MTRILSPFEIAQAAIVYWDYSNAIVAVAVAIPESAGGDAEAEGDPYNLVYRPDGASCQPYHCNGFVSFGLWQINICANWELVSGYVTPATPCNLRQWLFNPANNARAAYLIWQYQGWGAWSVYNLGLHRQYMAIAKEAVDLALQYPVTPPPPPPVQPPVTAIEPPITAVEPPITAVEPP